MISFENGSYSVPHQLLGQTVWVRRHGEQVVVVHVGAEGPVEVARHLATTAGSPRVDEAHFPPAPPTSLRRMPKARTAADAEFLDLGGGAVLWLTEAGAVGTSRVRAKMAQAVSLAKLLGADPVNWDEVNAIRPGSLNQVLREPLLINLSRHGLDRFGHCRSFPPRALGVSGPVTPFV